MKLKNKLIYSILFSSILFAADSPIQLPSSVPLEVYPMKSNQIGIGYIQFNVNLELEDSYYDDKIGDIKYDSKGLIYTTPADNKSNSYIGKMFELSYTLGTINGEIKDKIFTSDGKTYNNDYDKSGLYIGIRPSFNKNIFSNNKFIIKNSTTFHAFFFTLNGKFSVNDGTRSYEYDENAYGFALKPTTVVQATYYPLNRLGLTVFGGISTFIAVDWVFYEGGQNTASFVDEDNELEFLASAITPIFGYDISYKFSNDSIFNLSSVISKTQNDNTQETIFRYIYTF